MFKEMHLSSAFLILFYAFVVTGFRCCCWGWLAISSSMHQHCVLLCYWITGRDNIGISTWSWSRGDVPSLPSLEIIYQQI